MMLSAKYLAVVLALDGEDVPGAKAHLLELRGMIDQLESENRELREKVGGLASRLGEDYEMRLIRSAYWKVWKIAGGEIVSDEGPYCASCLKGPAKELNLLVEKERNRSRQCPVCEDVFPPG